MDFIFRPRKQTERITYTESKIDAPIPRPVVIQQSAPVVNFVMPPIPVSTSVPISAPILDEGKVPTPLPMVQRSVLSPAPLSLPVQVGNSNFSPNTETYPSIGTSYFLTDAQVNADVARWAIYPAVTNVDVGGFDIVNVSTLVSDNIDTNQIDTASGVSGGFVNTSKVQLQRIGTDPGQIEMYDNNNVPHILESVNSNLFFDGQLLAKANDIQDIADWALYPASADVDLVGQKLKGASEVQLGTLVLTDNAGILDVNGQPVSSNWALYPATQNVDIANFDITNVAKINGSAYVATKDWSTQVAVGNVDLANNNIVNVTDINGSPYPPVVPNWSTIPASQDVDIANFDILNVTNINGVPYPPPAGAVTSVNGGVGAITITGDVNTVVTNVVGTTTTISAPTLGVSTDLTTTCWGTANSASLSATSAGIAAGTAQTTALGAQATATSAAVAASAAEATALLALSQSGVTQVNGGTRQVTIAGGTGIGVVTTFSSGTLDPTVTISASGAFRASYDIYVAPNGNDTTGNGSQQNPYLTITRALTARLTIANTIEVAIHLASGTYNPVSLGITIPQNTFLIGIPAGEITQPVNIFAQVELQAGTGTVGLYGLNLFPAVSQCIIINDVGTYNINNCNIFNTTNYAIAQSEGTLFLTESRITSPTTGTLPGIGVIGSVATLIMRDCLMTSSGSSSLINCIGNLTIRQSNLINTSTATNVNPIVSFNPTAAGKTCEISFSTLQYTSAVSALNKICVRSNPSVGITASFVNFVNNLLICEGAQSGLGTFCIDKVAGSGPVTINYGNLLAGAIARLIDATITKTPFNVVS